MLVEKPIALTPPMPTASSVPPRRRRLRARRHSRRYKERYLIAREQIDRGTRPIVGGAARVFNLARRRRPY